jgi:DNA-binding transcriptional LysR family regulator
LSLELLETFVALAENGGDATRAAEQLRINQPSVSKRLSALRRLTSDRTRQSWLIRKGKRWQLTPEGQRVRVVVTDMIRRYEQLERFVSSGVEGKAIASIACGQQAAIGFVRASVERLLQEHPECRVRLSTPKGRTRIEGVAGGQFDLAIVTDSPTTIRKVAGREMYVEALYDDHFVLAANPAAKSAWRRQWQDLPEETPVVASRLLALPFILPEPDVSRREQFDDWCFRAAGKTLQANLEVGGWQTILEFVEAGLGIGLVPQSAVDVFQQRTHRKLSTRRLNPADFPPDAVRLIARKAHGKDEPDLSDLARDLVGFLKEKVRQFRD